jgi:hypothetical protein
MGGATSATFARGRARRTGGVGSAHAAGASVSGRASRRAGSAGCTRPASPTHTGRGAQADAVVAGAGWPPD